MNKPDFGEPASRCDAPRSRMCGAKVEPRQHHDAAVNLGRKIARLRQQSALRW
jgi:hypothetical protein